MSITLNSKSSETLAKMIENSNGKIFRVTFVKRDGSIRDLVGRTGVTKYLKGGKRTTDENKYLCVYDIQNHGYRSINRGNILAVRTEGIEAINTELKPI